MQSFEDALRQAGYPLPPQILRDGTIHRFGDKQRCWYLAHQDYAFAGDWKEEHSRITWKADGGYTMSAEEKRRLDAEIAKRQQEWKAQEQEAYLEAAKEALRQFMAAGEAGESAYLTRKGAKPYGIRYGMDTAPFIAIPLRDVAGTLWSLQKIYDDGVKRFLTGGRKRGCFHVIGSLQTDKPAYLVEGYATGATIHEATGMAVVVCFDAGSIATVLAALQPYYPVKNWIIAADNDAYTEVNTGKMKAEAAVKKFGCRMILPTFKDTGTKPSDFNDLAQLEGIEAVRQQLQQTKSPTALQSITLHDFLSLDFPPREMILDPVVPTQGLVMLYAIRGIGKTYVSLSIALTVATGSNILGDRWKATVPRRVLFVDGEMPASVLQERLASLSYSFGKELPSPEYLRIITPDMQEKGIPDLATDEGKRAIEQHLGNAELLVLDNLSALLRQGKENEAESWMPIQGWLLSLRKRGVSVLIIHHANKGGGQRGTSKKEDLLDTVIALKRPDDYDPTHGAQFRVEYEKARGFYGEEAKSFEARLVGDAGGLHWEVKDVEDALLERVLELKEAGLTQREIAQECNTSPATVNRILKKAKEQV